MKIALHLTATYRKVYNGFIVSEKHQNSRTEQRMQGSGFNFIVMLKMR